MGRGNGVLDGGLHRTKVRMIPRIEASLLDPAPIAFNQVEVRGVGGQKFQLDSQRLCVRLHRMRIDGGYGGPEFAQWARGLRPKLEVGGGADLRLVNAPPASGPRLRTDRNRRRKKDLYRDDTLSTQPIGLISQDS